MAELSLKHYLQLQGMSPSQGVRACCAPGMNTISLRSLMLSPRIIHISDPHFTDSSRTFDVGYLIDSQNSRLRSNLLSDYLINNKEQLGTNKVVITGDLTDSGDEGDYKIAAAFIEKLKNNDFDVYPIPGNHDYCWEGNLFSGTSADKNDRRNRFISNITGYNDYPHEIKLEYGWLILLDSMKAQLEESTSDTFAQGKLGDSQLTALEQKINSNEYLEGRKAGKKVIVCIHHSPFDSDPKGLLRDAHKFLDIVENKIDCLLFGHTSPTGILQEEFPDEESSYGIPLINCENFEHIAWAGEHRFGGDFAQQVCVGQNQDGRLEIFYVGINGLIYHNWQTAPNGDWAGEETLWGLLDSARQVCVGQNQDGRLEIFYVGRGFELYHNWQTIPGAAYPITVLDLGSYKRLVYQTNGSTPKPSWGHP